MDDEHGHRPPPAEPPPKPEAKSEEGAPAWMATFGDMMSLLLCFFVLLLSFANMDVVKFKAMAGSMDKAFGATNEENDGLGEEMSADLISLANGEQAPSLAVTEEDAPPPDDNAPPPENSPSNVEEERRKLDEELLEVVDNVLEARGLDDRVEAVLGDQGVTIRAESQMMFPPGADVLRPEASAIMEEIAELAALFPYKIVVQGHTDNRRIATERFPTNWELSASRAIAGVRYLIDIGAVEPDRVSAAAFSDTRPLMENSTEAGRAKNSRIEFVFYREDG